MGAIAVLGPGGVGGFLAAVLARAGEAVTVVARPATTALIAADGIELHSVWLGDFVARPDAVEVLLDHVEVLLVATKAGGLASGLERIETAPGLVVPLLNGIDHMPALRERFGHERVAAGSIRIESNRRAAGKIVQTSPSVRVELAADAPALRPALDALRLRLERAGIPAAIGDSEAQVLWSKLVRLCALACTTSASDRPIGVIRSDPEWRAALVGCIEEAAAVANADGAHIDPGARLAELEDAHADLGSSMQRDITAGREPELDAIAGAVLRAGRRHGIVCPTIERLSAIIAERAGVPAPTF